RLELGNVPARAETEHEASTGELVDGGRHPRQQAGRMERGAGDERAELDALGDPGEPGERRPTVPRAAVRAAVEQVVADPDRVEAGLLGGPRHRRELVPPDVPLDLRELYADLHSAPLTPKRPRTPAGRTGWR